MSKTIDDLKTAFAGESQAFQKYTAYAKKAAAQGFTNIAKLFEATAQAELIHAAGHLKALDQIQDTLDNLQDAINGETYEFTEMYPGFIRDAEEEGQKNAVRAFTFANEAEKVHGELYKKALASMEKGKDSTFFLCPVCGYVEEGHAPDVCPICKAKKDVFVTVA